MSELLTIGHMFPEPGRRGARRIPLELPSIEELRERGLVRPEPEYRCQVCQDTGWERRDPAGGPRTAWPCRSCPPPEPMSYADFVSSMGIGSRYGVRKDWLDEEWPRDARDKRGRYDPLEWPRGTLTPQPWSLTLVGQNSSGKTTRAIEIAYRAHCAGRRVVWANAWELIRKEVTARRLPPRFDEERNSKSWREAMDADILFFDGVFEERGTIGDVETAAKLAGELIDHRYAHELQTCVTTHLRFSRDPQDPDAGNSLEARSVMVSERLREGLVILSGTRGYRDLE